MNINPKKISPTTLKVALNLFVATIGSMAREEIPNDLLFS
jgi:hypothetical protein